MEGYHARFMEAAHQRVNLSDKTILEVGCGSGEMLKEIAAKYKPAMIIGVDPKVIQEQQGDNWRIVQGDVTALKYPDCSFDVVISVATFEHITNLPKAFSEIKRILKPFGKLYVSLGPIWTSIRGHHYRLADRKWAELIPPWGHLWLNQNEMFNYLQPLVGEEEARKACSSIYECKRLNRLTRRDYYNIILNSGMWVRFVQEWISLSRFSRFGDRESEYSIEIYKKLAKKYQPQDLSVDGITFLLEKYANL